MWLMQYSCLASPETQQKNKDIMLAVIEMFVLKVEFECKRYLPRIWCPDSHSKMWNRMDLLCSSCQHDAIQLVVRTVPIERLPNPILNKPILIREYFWVLHLRICEWNSKHKLLFFIESRCRVCVRVCVSGSALTCLQPIAIEIHSDGTYWNCNGLDSWCAKWFCGNVVSVRQTRCQCPT